MPNDPIWEYDANSAFYKDLAEDLRDDTFRKEFMRPARVWVAIWENQAPTVHVDRDSLMDHNDLREQLNVADDFGEPFFDIGDDFILLEDFVRAYLVDLL